MMNRIRHKFSRVLLALILSLSLFGGLIGNVAQAAVTLPTFDSDLSWNGGNVYKVADYGAQSQFFVPNSGNNDKLLRADGYAWNSRDFVLFPGSKGVFTVNPYTFWGSYTKDTGAANMTGQSTSVAPITAFYIVLPKTMTTTQTELQAALDTYTTQIKNTNGIDASSLSKLEATQQTAFEGRQVWLVTPNVGAKFLKRTKAQADLIPVFPLNFTISVDTNAKDLAGVAQSSINLQPSDATKTQTQFNSNVIYNIIPFQYFNGKDVSFMADANMTGGTVSPDYGTLGSVKSWTHMKLDGTTWKTITENSYSPTFPTFAQSLLTSYNQTNRTPVNLMALTTARQYRFAVFDPNITDTFSVVTNTGTDTGLKVSMKYQVKVGSDGKLVGGYVLDTTNTDIKAIRAKGYDIQSIVQTRDYKAPLATATGKTEDWTKKTETLWTKASASFDSLAVTNNYPIDTSVQWDSLPAKVSSLATRSGVITVQSVSRGPLNIKVVDYKNNPLPNINVTLKNSKGELVTKDFSGNPLVLKTDENGNITAPNLPYDTYTVTQVDTVTGLIKPGPKTATLNTTTGTSVTLVNTRELVPTDLPLTGSNDMIFTMAALMIGGIATFALFVRYQKRRSN